MPSSNVSVIGHYQRKMERHPNEPEVLRHALTKLSKLNGMSIAVLHETGIGRTVNALRKCEDDTVAALSKELVNKWKELVANEEEEEEERDEEDYEEQGGDEYQQDLDQYQHEGDEVQEEGKAHEEEENFHQESSSRHHGDSSSEHHGERDESTSKHHRDRDDSSSRHHREHSSRHHRDKDGSDDRDLKQRKKSKKEKKKKSSSREDRHHRDHHHHHSSSKHKHKSSSPSGDKEKSKSSSDASAKPNHGEAAASSSKSTVVTSSSSSLILPNGVSPHYKPLPPRKSDSSQNLRRNLMAKMQSEDEALSALMARSKAKGGQRTAVYSGAKRTGFYDKVPSLEEACIHVLQENVESIEECGNIPFHLLEPVLERSSPQNLIRIEGFNPYLMTDTAKLWERFCKKNFPKEEREEMESWREMFERCTEEREAKLNRLKEKVKDSYHREKVDAKKAKLAYVGLNAKPPRNVVKAQARNGTGLPVGQALPAKGSVRPGLSTLPSGGSAKKPKVAPMMAKTLKMVRGMKSGFRR